MNQGRKDIETALHYAASNGFAEIVKTLIYAGAAVNKIGKKDRTALMFAAEGGHDKCVESLIKGGADVNLVDSKRDTALHMASSGGYPKCVNHLVNTGANVNVRGNSRTPLTEAIYNGHDKCVDLLIKSGSDVNQRLPLLLAAKKRYYKCMDVLTQAGAVVNSDIDSALLRAVEGGHYRCVDSLIKDGADVNIGWPDRHLSRTSLLIAAVIAILPGTVTKSWSFYYSNSSLYYALRRGHNKCVKLPIEAGFEDWGTTASLNEAERDSLENVVLLMREGVAVSPGDNFEGVFTEAVNMK